MFDIQILHTPGCGTTPRLVKIIDEVRLALAPSARLVLRDVSRETQAMVHFAGSPTVLVDGRDMEPEAQPMQGFG